MVNNAFLLSPADINPAPKFISSAHFRFDPNAWKSDSDYISSTPKCGVEGETETVLLSPCQSTHNPLPE